MGRDRERRQLHQAVERAKVKARKKGIGKKKTVALSKKRPDLSRPRQVTTISPGAPGRDQLDAVLKRKPEKKMKTGSSQGEVSIKPFQQQKKVEDLNLGKKEKREKKQYILFPSHVLKKERKTR